MTQEELKAAYDRFDKIMNDHYPNEFDEICSALSNYREKLSPDRAMVFPNRICAMLAVEAMLSWEIAELNRD